MMGKSINRVNIPNEFDVCQTKQTNPAAASIFKLLSSFICHSFILYISKKSILIPKYRKKKCIVKQSNIFFLTIIKINLYVIENNTKPN